MVFIERLSSIPHFAPYVDGKNCFHLLRLKVLENVYFQCERLMSMRYSVACRIEKMMTHKYFCYDFFFDRRHEESSSNSSPTRSVADMQIELQPIKSQASITSDDIKSADHQGNAR